MCNSLCAAWKLRPCEGLADLGVAQESPPSSTKYFVTFTLLRELFQVFQQRNRTKLLTSITEWICGQIRPYQYSVEKYLPTFQNTWHWFRIIFEPRRWCWCRIVVKLRERISLLTRCFRCFKTDVLTSQKAWLYCCTLSSNRCPPSLINL